MKQPLNTLFVTLEAITSLDSENVVASQDKPVVARHSCMRCKAPPFRRISDADGHLSQKGIGLAFCISKCCFLARVCGENTKNVQLCRKQYRIANVLERICLIAGNMIFCELQAHMFSR